MVDGIDLGENGWVGVDPGKKGALAYVWEEGVKIHAWAFPFKDVGIMELLDAFTSLRPLAARMALIEKVGSMPGNGVSSMFNFGRAYGLQHMALATTGIRMEDVRPLAWQRFYGNRASGKGLSKSQHKNALKSLAMEFFPGMKITLDTADAILLAEYARQKDKFGK